jgi:hypothetical protein
MNPITYAKCSVAWNFLRHHCLSATIFPRRGSGGGGLYLVGFLATGDTGWDGIVPWEWEGLCY